MQRGRIVVETFDSEILKGNPLGDPSERRFPVYLPPSYDGSNESYPVVFLLTGFTGHGMMFMNQSFMMENIEERLNRLIDEETMKEMIVVMPDCITKYGGSQYINSTATGNYEDYVIKELVPYIDGKYRTKADAGSRAVIGKSSGGYGSVVLAMKNPDVFSMMCSTAGDMYFEFCYLPEFPRFVPAIEKKYGKGDEGVKNFIKNEINYRQPKPKTFHDIMNAIGMSSCYSPDPGGFETKGYNFDLPFDTTTGEMRWDVFKKWKEHDPVDMAEKYADNLRKLKLIYLDAGTSDEFYLNIGARIFCSKLDGMGIKYIHEEFEGGHFNVQYRNDRSFEVVSESL
jgi:S-formylglutathione hydrolase FrmB